MKKILLYFFIIAIILVPILALAQNGYNDRNWGWMGSMMGGFWPGMGGGFSMFFGWIFWIVLIVLAVWLIKSMVGGDRRWHEKKEDSAIETLKQRYAKGEINRQEFEEKMKDIM